MLKKSRQKVQHHARFRLCVDFESIPTFDVSERPTAAAYSINSTYMYEKVDKRSSLSTKMCVHLTKALN